MEIDIQDELNRDGLIVYSVLYSSVTVAFAVAVLTKFLTNEFRFGFRSFLSLIILFLGEPLCQFLVKGPGGLVIFSVGCLIIYSVLPASHLPAQNKAVLITGCDSGFGHALTLKLDSMGMQVFAGCLEDKGPGAVELRNKCSDKLTILKLDVTDAKDIEAASAYISSKLGDEGLWGLVNNAGVWCFAELEMTSEKIVQKIMDVNLFGAVRVTKSVLPLIKKAQGRIVNVSSLLGRVSLEGNGAYSMSKHALVAYTNTLRQLFQGRVSLEGNGAYSMSKHALVAYTNTLRLEMKKWGVDVCIVEPTGFFTGNTQEHILRKTKEDVWETLDAATQEVYGKDYLEAVYTHIQASVQRHPKDLTPVIRCIRSGLLSKRPRERFPCGSGAEILIFLHSVLPVWAADYLSSSISILPKQLRPKALSVK